MFIIEGADNLGKTTAAKKIVKICKEKLGFPTSYFHMGRPNERFNFSTHYRDHMKIFSVQDRFHLGAWVYHPPGTMSLDTLKWVEAELAIRASYTVIFVPADDNAYLERLQNSKRDEMLSPEEIVESGIKFRNLIPMVQHDAVFFFNGTYPSDELLEKWASEWVARVKRFERLGFTC